MFGIKPVLKPDSIKTHPNNVNLIICSKGICDYFKSLGFKTGDKIKNGSQIPKEIFSDEKLFYACMRGLNDTNGCVGKDGSILCVRFSNSNQVLMDQLRASEFLIDLFGIRSNSEQIGTRSQKSIDIFFSLIGSSNLRHVVRYLEARNGNLIYKPEVTKYYKKHGKLNMPCIFSS